MSCKRGRASDVGTWHGCWQKKFDMSMHERPLRHNKRFADVWLGQTSILEIQHSFISKREVDNRRHDYHTLASKQIIWLLDGNAENRYTDVRIVQRTRGSHTTLAFFQSQQWPLHSFSAYDIIYIHQGQRVYQVSLHTKLFGCVVVTATFTDQEFVNLLLATPDIMLCQQHEPVEPSAALDGRIRLLQGVPGNGKTYSSVHRALQSVSEYKHYNTFLFLTKSKSARMVIVREFQEQLRHLDLLVTLEELPRSGTRIRFNKSGQHINILIVTLDSLIYTLSHGCPQNIMTDTLFQEDLFSQKARYVATHGADFTTTHYSRLKGVDIEFSPETLIVLDEGTHAKQVYFDAIVQLMLQTGCDTDIIGDIMQSTLGGDNCMTQAWTTRHQQSTMVRIETTQESQIRRFSASIVNFLVDVIGPNTYAEYGLDPPVAHVDAPRHGDITVTTMPNLNIYQDNQYAASMSDITARIVRQLDRSVDELYLLPEDVLCVFPIININPFARLVQTAIHRYWSRKVYDTTYRDRLCTQDPDTTRRQNAVRFFEKLPLESHKSGVDWAIVHTSEGQSIDVTTSIHTTRMVSFHSAQGDGRQLVFVLQLSTRMLKFHDRGPTSDTLKLLSLLNVALSRPKRRMFVYLERDPSFGIDAEMASRFTRYLSPDEVVGDPDKRELRISPFISNISVCDTMPIEQYDRLHSRVLEDFGCFLAQRTDVSTCARPLVDFGHHMVRMSVVQFFIFILGMQDEHNQFDKRGAVSPFLAIMYKIRRKRVVTCANRVEYIRILSTREKNDTIIPIMCYPNFEHVHTKIVTDIHYIQSVLKQWTAWGDVASMIPKLEPNHMILLWHIIQLNEHRRWAETDIKVIYEVYTIQTENDHLRTHYALILNNISLLWHRLVAGCNRKQLCWNPGKRVYGLRSDNKDQQPEFQFGQKCHLISKDTNGRTVYLIVLPTIDESRQSTILDYIYNFLLISGTSASVCWFICATTHEVFEFSIPCDTITRKQCADTFLTMVQHQYVSQHTNVQEFIKHVPNPFATYTYGDCVRRKSNAEYILLTMSRLEEYCEDNQMDRPPSDIIDQYLERYLKKSMSSLRYQLYQNLGIES